MGWFLLIMALVYGFILHQWKDEINRYLDKTWWFTSCRFCRGVEFGAVLGVLLTLAISLIC